MTGRGLVAALACALWVACRPGVAAGVQVRHVTTYGRGAVRSTAVAPHLIAIAIAGDVALFALGEGRRVETLQLGRVALVDAVALTADGHYVVAHASDGVLDVWDLPCGVRHSLDDFPNQVGESPLRAWAAGGGVHAGWEDLQTGIVGWHDVSRFPTPATAPALPAQPAALGSDAALAWAPDRMFQPRARGAIVTGWMPAGTRRALEVWDTTTRTRLLATSIRAARWRRVSADGRLLAVGTYDRAGVRVYDVGGGGSLPAASLTIADLAACGLPPPHPLIAELLPDGHVYRSRPMNTQLVGLLPAEWREQAKRWVLSAGMRSCDSMPPPVEASYRDQWQDLPILAFSYSRPLRVWALAISSSFGLTDLTNGIVLWDHDTHERLRALDGHALGAATKAGETRYVHDLAFSPDGRYLVSGGEDATVRLWDMPAGAEIAALTGHVGPVQHVAFAPDGRRFVSASDDGTVREWVISVE